MIFILALSLLEWFLILFAAVLVGLNKTGLPTLGVLILTILLLVFPAKIAIGIMLPMLIIADVFAILYYRQYVMWRQLFPLLPWVLCGIVLGYFILDIIDGERLKFVIGILVIGLVTLHVVQNEFGGRIMRALPNSTWFVSIMGILGGFTTMVGNAAGEVLAIYLTVKGVPKREFIGTTAWFFFIVNLIKIPFYFQLGLIDATIIKFDLLLVIPILLGAILGINLLPRISQKVFTALILILATIGGVNLII